MAQTCLQNALKNLKNLRADSKYDLFVAKTKSQ